MRKLLLILVLLRPSAANPAGAATEERVKAAVLLQLAHFVEWPVAALPHAQAPLQICVLGDDRTFVVLEELARSQSVDGRQLLARRLVKPQEARSCHVVFWAGSVEPAQLRSLEGAPVFTVGDDPAFATSGGVMNLIFVKGRTVFEINPTAATKAGLRINSKLLRLARVLGGPTP